MNLFDFSEGTRVTGCHTRSATDQEVRAYLKWLAAERGLHIPTDAHFDHAGIGARENGTFSYILDMPGYGVTDVVIMETVDEANAVIRSQSVTDSRRGGISLKADQVQAATGLAKGRKPRAAPPRFPLDPRRALTMTAEEMRDYCAMARQAPAPVVAIDTPPVEMAMPPVVETPAAPAPAIAPEADPVAALVQRIATLERVVDDLMVIALREDTPTRGDAMPDPVPLPADPRARAVLISRASNEDEKINIARARRLRLIRSYLAIRAQRAALRQQLATAAKAAERAEFDAIEARGQRDAAIARADAAEAVTIPALDDAQGRIVKLERQLATWRQRATDAGYREVFPIHLLRNGGYVAPGAAA